MNASTRTAVKDQLDTLARCINEGAALARDMGIEVVFGIHDDKYVTIQVSEDPEEKP